MRADDWQIVIEGEAMPIRLRKYARARSIRLAADPLTRTVKLSMPKGGSERQALAFAQSKADWLAEQFARHSGSQPILPDGLVSYAGEPRRIDWHADYPRRPQLHPDRIALGGPREHVERRVIGWLRDEARRTMTADLAEYCAKLGRDPPRLSIGDARSRWGSCSSRGTVRMSWRLIMAPANVRRAVVAHEAAHLVHMNHGAHFYALLDALFEGDRRAADRWLRREGAGLYRIGCR